MTDARYALVLLDEPNERFPLTGTATVGRHLDNDFVIAGEDVRDFHVRIETTDRGPRVITIDGATAHVGEMPVEGSAGLRPGTELIIGAHRLRLDIEGTPAPCGWKLHRIGDAVGVPIAPSLSVGRATSCDLQLVEGHVSRHHAQLAVVGGTVWVEDLGSANGTFVNGDRVVGAWRLYHGDELAFDTMRYQLIGDSPDLTPIRPPGQPPDQLEPDRLVEATAAPDGAREPSDLATAAFEPASAASLSTSAETLATGPSLIGRSAPIAGRIFPLTFGRHLIGRGPDADIHIAEASVSLRHAEVEIRPDGAQVVNLISTNGTWVNDVEIHTRKLVDGDVVRVGRVTLQYRAPPTSSAPPRSYRIAWIATLATLSMLVGAAGWYFLS